MQVAMKKAKQTWIQQWCFQRIFGKISPLNEQSIKIFCGPEQSYF